MTTRGSIPVRAQNAHGSASSSSQVLSLLAFPFTACFNGLRGDGLDHEREGLLGTGSTGREGGQATSYDDSDAISLLSNIQDRARRRSRRRNRRSVAALGCGLFGRTRGQIEEQEQPAARTRRQHASNVRQGGSQRRALLGTRGDSDDESDFGESGLYRGMPRSDSAASGESGLLSSLAGAQESGDEDAGMLGDADIAELSNSRTEEVPQTKDMSGRWSKHEDEGDAIQRKQQLEEEAKKYAREEAEQRARQIAEEEELAAREEAEAQRRAKALKQHRDRQNSIKEKRRRAELSDPRQISRQRRLTEAEAEAAAGGFDFAEEPEAEDDFDQERFAQYNDNYHVGHEGYEEHYEQNPYSEPHQPEVIVHHHHYHGPPQVDQTLAPHQFSTHDFEHEQARDEELDSHDDIHEEDENDADIAGLSFGKKRVRKTDGKEIDGSSESRQSSDKAQLQQSCSSTLSPRKNGVERSFEEQSSTSGSVKGKSSYREAPRRRERESSTRVDDNGNIGQGGQPSTDATLYTHDERADAAAGGFDDYIPTSPPSSASNERSSRRREQPRTAKSSAAQSSAAFQGRGDLNAPRNPAGRNPFM